MFLDIYLTLPVTFPLYSTEMRKDPRQGPCNIWIIYLKGQSREIFIKQLQLAPFRGAGWDDDEFGRIFAELIELKVDSLVLATLGSCNSLVLVTTGSCISEVLATPAKYR